MRPRNGWIAVAGMLGASMCMAGDPATDAMTSAYKPYRVALFRTNSKAQVESEAAVAQASQAWRDLISKFSKNPPPPYDRDADFGTALANVAAVYEQASAQIHEQKLSEAHETLEKVRDLMAQVRRRNNVIVYSDHMNAYHAEMEHMLIDGPQWVGQAQGFLLLMEQLGTMEFLAARLRSEAPSELASDSTFGPAMKMVDQSLAGLREAILAQDATRVREALSKLKGPYSQLFLKFG